MPSGPMNQVKAGDFVYSYRRILNQELAAQYGYMVQALKNGKLFNTGKKCSSGLWLLTGMASQGGFASGGLGGSR